VPHNGLMLTVLQDLAGTTTAAALADVSPLRIILILGVAALLHVVVRTLRRAGEWVVTPDSSPEVARELLTRRRPKTATVTTLVVSATTFVIYYFAFYFVVDELQLFDPVAYLASATVIGLAVGFGSQGLVQDIVIGVTLIFSDAFNVGDVVEISGQIGRVEKVGLRFTTLSNFLGQTVFIPNRTIGVIGRYRRGAVRAFIDMQITAVMTDQDMIDRITRLTRGLRAQQRAVLLTEPEVVGPFTAEPDDWRFIRVKLRIWPGQGGFVETAMRQRLLATLRTLDPDYADWMLTISYRASS
jgi:moderate conductance mechanosensitive channel